MKKEKAAGEENCVYPGQYVPMIDEENLRYGLKAFPQDAPRFLPPVNFTESDLAYRVEVAVPGMEREDFLVRTDGRQLVISLLHKTEETDEATYRIHEFNYACFERRVELPGQADLSMIHASYRNGILGIHIPKSERPIEMRGGRIAVY